MRLHVEFVMLKSISSTVFAYCSCHGGNKLVTLIGSIKFGSNISCDI